MNTYDIIKKKRDGDALSAGEIRHMVNGFTEGAIPDYQMAAFLMAVYYRGMSPRECIDLTMAMADSGERIDLSGIRGFKVDKHSTGGVGDTTTLVLAPLVAASGGTVAKLTGRELGHTGGTVDKLESIPGFQIALSKDRFVEVVNTVHAGLTAQTARLAPADKKIYALRNVTATVDSIPLIASSIMSKKLTAGSDGILLDVKTGSGALTRTYEDSLTLAKTMVDIGEGAGIRTVALITGMDQPLGYAVGNALEVKEAIDTLNGNGPRDLVDLVLELGKNMLLMSGIVTRRQEALKILRRNIETQKGLEKFGDMIQAQGGNRKVIDDPGLLPRPRTQIDIRSIRSGFVEKIDAREVGLAAKMLGAGRSIKDESLDLSIGIYLNKKVGDRVQKSESLGVFHSDGDKSKIASAKEKFLNAYTVGEKDTDPPVLFYARVSKDGIEKLDGHESANRTD